jgi:hypothetical protein
MQVIYSIIRCLAIGLMVAVIWWVYPHPSQWEPKQRRGILLKTIITVIIAGAAMFALSSFLALNQTMMTFLAGVAVFIILLRLARLTVKKTITKKRLNILSLYDFIIGSILFFLFALYINAMGEGRYLSVESVLGYLMVTVINTKKQKHALSINKASFHELNLLPGIGPQLAGKIVNGRPYRTIDQLERVKGIGKNRSRKGARQKSFTKSFFGGIALIHYILQPLA